MDRYVPDFFHINVTFLKYGALWPPTGRSKIAYKAYIIFKIFVLFLTLGFSTFSVIVGLVIHIDNFFILIQVLNVGATMLLSCVKIIFWLKNEDRIKLIMRRLESETFRYEDTEDFNPTITLKRAKKSGVRYALLLWIFAQLCLGFAYIPISLLSLRYYFRHLSISGVKAFDTLPYYMYVPFRHDTAIKYFLACLLQGTPCYLCATAFVGVDSLFMNMMNLIATHMSILRGAFRTMRRRCLEKIEGPDLTSDGLYNSDELEERMMVEMKKCVRHLQLLFRSCKDIEDVFQYVSLSQALATIYILCSTLLLVSTAQLLTKEFGKNLFYIIGIILQLGLYCWFGNQLTLEAEGLPLALWQSDWLQTRIPYKTCMLLTMIRLKRPLQINAGKFVPLILDTQIAVLKGSYSYYTVLKGMSK